MPSMETEFRFTKTTVLEIEAEPKRRWYRDLGTPGLNLCVTPKGSKTFYVVRRVSGQGRKGNTEFIRLGRFAELTVEEARAAARLHLKTLHAGDSVKAKAHAKKDEVKIEDLWAMWKAERALGKNEEKPLKKSWKKDQRLYDCHLKRFATRRMSEVTGSLAHKIFDDVTTYSGPVEANHVQRLARAMWNHIIKKRELIISNPWTTVKPNKEQNREIWVSVENMPFLLASIESLENQDSADLFKLCLYSGARSGNVKAMRWDQIYLQGDTWTIPSSHHKNNKIHTIPLSPPAMEILRRRVGIHKVWVFPSNNSASGHIESMRSDWKTVLKTLSEKLGSETLEGLRIHDLRHTVASWLATQGVSLPMIGKILGHASPQTTARYAHLSTDPLREVLNRAVRAMDGSDKDPLPESKE